MAVTSASVLLSVVYSLGQITLGLLFHPYQTVQSLVRDKVFIWMAFLPIAVYVLAKVVWSLVLVPVLSFVFSCSSASAVGFLCGFIPFFANWLILFCVFWQILLLYLLIRFWLVFAD